MRFYLWFQNEQHFCLGLNLTFIIGMVAYYMLTGGKHPFGIDDKVIKKALKVQNNSRYFLNANFWSVIIEQSGN